MFLTYVGNERVNQPEINMWMTCMTKVTSLFLFPLISIDEKVINAEGIPWEKSSQNNRLSTRYPSHARVFWPATRTWCLQGFTCLLLMRVLFCTSQKGPNAF